VTTAPFALLAALGTAGAAPLTVADVTAAVMAGNPDLAGASASREAAEGALYASRGLFDPSLSISAGTSRDQRIGFFQGFPFKSLSRQWCRRSVRQASCTSELASAECECD
jgi:outer membrane protein TolC